MIERYTRPEMGAIWSQDHKIQQWLAVEIAVCEAWARRGRIPEEAMIAIRGASCDLERMLEIEKETDHDLISFLRATGETVGDASRFIHLGLTSSDVVDTGLAMQARDAADLLLRDLDEMIDVVGRKSLEHKDTITIGRSHGMQAEPTTFGLKLLVWYDELRRQRERLVMARDQISVGQISGAVGTHAHVSLELEEEVCADLDLGIEYVSTQVIQRDRHAFFLSVLAVIASTLEKMTVEVRHLQRSEVAEAEEAFGEGNQGSSAMPHKRNPHESERIAGLARLVRANAIVGFENVPLWHERDISHSSAERVIFPDACIVLDFMLHETTEIIDGLVVYPEKMLANLNMSGGLIFSQRILLALVDGGMDRQEAYRLVQRHAHAHDDRTFRERIEADTEVQARVSAEAIESAFDPWDQLQNVDATFRRVGLIA
ncbi:MAG: adenylosuccinate lyase [Thermomicrobiales bacterium]|nr:adenylosuccinate lyase [Thermomicrobiales bacterium]